MKRILAVLAMVILASLVMTFCSKKDPANSGPVTGTPGSSATATPVPTSTPDDGYSRVTTAGLTFAWKVNGANLDCKASAPTTGWVSVGLNTAAQMNGANMILGYVTGGSTAVITDQKGGFHVHSMDTLDNITNKAGTESGGITEITFTIPLADDTNGQDILLTPGNTYWLINTYGSNGDDSTGSGMPPNRGMVQIQI